MEERRASVIDLGSARSSDSQDDASRDNTDNAYTTRTVYYNTGSDWGAGVFNTAFRNGVCVSGQTGGGTSFISCGKNGVIINGYGNTMNSFGNSNVVINGCGGTITSFGNNSSISCGGNSFSVSNAFEAGHQALNQTLKAGQRALTQMFRTGHWAMSRTLQADQRRKTRAVDRVKHASVSMREMMTYACILLCINIGGTDGLEESNVEKKTSRMLYRKESGCV